MTPAQQVREMLAEGYDAETIVSVLVAQADEHSFRTMAESWLRTEVDRQKRSQARYVERDQFAIRRKQRIEEAVAKAAPIKAAMSFTAAFLATEFALGDGRVVTWGAATVSDHGERCEMLGKKIDGIAETVAQHREIIDLLSAAGAACLNALRPVA